MSRSQFFLERERSRKSGPNSVGVGAGSVRDCPTLLEAGSDFRSWDRLRDEFIMEFISISLLNNYGIHERIRAGSEEAGAVAVKNRFQPGRSRSRSYKDRFQSCRDQSCCRAGAEFDSGSGPGTVTYAIFIPQTKTIYIYHISTNSCKPAVWIFFI